MVKPNRMKISFAGDDPLLELKERRAAINFKIITGKNKAEGMKLQKELANVNKLIRKRY